MHKDRLTSSPRRKICRVVLTLNHSKRTNGPLVELNERVNSEKSAMRVAQCNARHASWIEEGWFVENVNSKFDSRRLPPPSHVSPPSSRCVISMPYGTNVDAQVFDNTHSSFLYYRSVSIGHPSIRSPFFFFPFFFFFNRNLSRSLLLLYTPWMLVVDRSLEYRCNDIPFLSIPCPSSLDGYFSSAPR